MDKPLILDIPPGAAALAATVHQNQRHDIERLRAALEPFAKVADHQEMDKMVCGDEMTVTVALINGNVTQSVLHWVLKAGDFRRAKALLSEIQ